jgi:secretion/DNA translocation related TadE-like protein
VTRGQPRGTGGVPPTKATRAATDGAAGVLLCGVMVLVVALTLGLGRLATASLARARAQTAADAAALAAAGELAAGRTAGEAERTAWVAAAANGARLLRCDCGGPAVFVAVSVVLPFSRPVSGLVRAAARAELHPECPG